MSATRIDRILQNLGAAPATTKQASETAPAPAAQTTKQASVTTPAATALSASLQAALQPVTTKQAAEAAPAPAGTPVEALTKLAADVAKMDDELREKQAKLYAGIFADEVISRINSYEKQAAERAPVPAGQLFSKVAAEQPGMIREAAEQSYQSTRAKLANESQIRYENGWNKGFNELSEKMAAEFYSAAVVTNQCLQAALAK